MAGLPVNYVIRQMQDYKSGDRASLYRRHNSMLLSATHATDEEVRAAAEYYAGIEPVKWVTVIEAETVPETYVGPGNMRHPEPDGGTEPIGQRIIEIPEDSHRPSAGTRTALSSPMCPRAALRPVSILPTRAPDVPFSAISAMATT